VGMDDGDVVAMDKWSVTIFISVCSVCLYDCCRFLEVS